MSALRNRRPLLVHGPLLDGSSLSAELKQFTGAEVVSCDCTRSLPEPNELARLFAKGLKKGAILHVSIDTELVPSLLDAVKSVAADQRLPDLGEGGGADVEGLLVLSARVKWPTELGHDLRDYFPIVVGVS